MGEVDQEQRLDSYTLAKAIGLLGWIRFGCGCLMVFVCALKIAYMCTYIAYTPYTVFLLFVLFLYSGSTFVIRYFFFG